MKTCCRCGETKSRDLYPRKTGACRECCNVSRRSDAERRAYFREWQREYRKRWTPEQKERHRRGHDNARLIRLYGITLAEFETVAALQGGVCAVCKQPPPQGRRLCVDHDHLSGAIRGLLCSKCNRAIGYLGDSPEGVARAIEYLAKPTLLPAQSNL